MSKKYPLEEEARAGGYLMLFFGTLWIIGQTLLMGLTAVPAIGILFNPSSIFSGIPGPTLASTYATLWGLAIYHILPWVLVFCGGSLLAKTESEID